MIAREERFELGRKPVADSECLIKFTLTYAWKSSRTVLNVSLSLYIIWGHEVLELEVLNSYLAIHEYKVERGIGGKKKKKNDFLEMNCFLDAKLFPNYFDDLKNLKWEARSKIGAFS